VAADSRFRRKFPPSQQPSLGCATLLALLDPQALILGGGLVENNPILIQALSLELEHLVRPWENRTPSIVASGLGYHGGVLGAAALAFDRLSTTPVA
jgi:predicted NBD/HSP70 family sugar kinase